jgi:predicted RNA-binding Zn-ribbon protein involved in translation (DUF1610 family)
MTLTSTTNKRVRLDENGEEAISLCNSCHCMTKSIDEGVCFKCAKCGETK